MSAPLTTPVARRHLRVLGQVQGVGFRPFVYRLATELGLQGWVRNDTAGVEAEIQGPAAGIEEFIQRLRHESPPLAHIDALTAEARRVEYLAGPFRILASGAGAVRTGITPDVTVCPQCLAELFDPGDRRYRYPFLNCTHCGPRYTLTRALPYDRPNTAMARFPQCPRCQAEYDDPADRRFHAQPNACPVCGPRLALWDEAGRVQAAGDPIAQTAALLQAGRIVAVKGLGGFHLVCDARDAGAVARLRERKQREEKPLAVMAAGPASLDALVRIGNAERALIKSPERPIVLLRKRTGCDAALTGIAPGIAWLGAMLAYTPLHYLLFHEAAHRPGGTGWLDAPQDLLLVMTSANPGGEPLVTDNPEALRRLAGIADAYLVHDRDIEVRCDDSVVRHTGRHPAFVRRARGYTPRALALVGAGPAVLATGAGLKSTACLSREREAFVSQHVGDLDNAATCEALESTVEHLARVLQFRPQRIAHDLHPDLFSTRLAIRLAAERQVPALGVQHHHAHAAAVAAEHRLSGPFLALILDGVGLGSDGKLWGGELLRVDGARFERLGHLRELPLPGGDRAAREPWRMAAAALHVLGRGTEIAVRFPRPGVGLIGQMLDRGSHAPLTSSAGRWFDAAAGLLGVCRTSSFEAQAAMLLEGLAERHGPVAPMSAGFHIDGAGGTLDLLPLLNRLADEPEAGRGAALFHATLAQALVQWVVQTARGEGLDRVVLSGGCCVNQVLSRALVTGLRRAGVEAYEAVRLPPNDGGISLGQAWVARQADVA